MPLRAFQNFTLLHLFPARMTSSVGKVERITSDHFIWFFGWHSVFPQLALSVYCQPELNKAKLYVYIYIYIQTHFRLVVSFVPANAKRNTAFCSFWVLTYYRWFMFPFSCLHSHQMTVKTMGNPLHGCHPNYTSLQYMICSYLTISVDQELFTISLVVY